MLLAIFGRDRDWNPFANKRAVLSSRLGARKISHARFLDPFMMYRMLFQVNQPNPSQLLWLWWLGLSTGNFGLSSFAGNVSRITVGRNPVDLRLALEIGNSSLDC